MQKRVVGVFSQTIEITGGQFGADLEDIVNINLTGVFSFKNEGQFYH